MRKRFRFKQMGTGGKGGCDVSGARSLRDSLGAEESSLVKCTFSTKKQGDGDEW